MGVVADLGSTAGVVTIDLVTNPSNYYRVSTTESITQWVITGAADADSFLLRVERNAGHSVSWTGLADTWTDGVPVMAEGQTIHFPMVNDQFNWIGQTENVATASPADVLQVIAHDTDGILGIDLDNGHQVEVVMEADITGHLISNGINGKDARIYYLASTLDRDIDFTGEDVVEGFPGAAPPATPVTVAVDTVYESVWSKAFNGLRLRDVGLFAGALNFGWSSIDLPVTAVTTVDPTVTWTGGVGLVKMDWQDGSGIEDLVTGVQASHVYGPAFTGSMRLWYRADAVITGMDFSGRDYSFDLSAISVLSGLTTLDVASSLVTGTLTSLSGMSGLSILDFSTSGVLGTFAGISALTSMTQVRGFANATFAGNTSELTALTSLTILNMANTDMLGDVANLAGLTALTLLGLANTDVSGVVSSLSPLVNLTEFRLNGTSVSGDPSPICTAAVAGLDTFFYHTVGANPTAPQLDACLLTLAGGSVSSGTMDISGTNPAPTDGASITTLEGRSWTVTRN